MINALWWFTNFADRHWFLALALIAVLGGLVSLPFQIVNRVIRHRNIAAAGWPTPPLDADGDIVEEDKL